MNPTVLIQRLKKPRKQFRKSDGTLLPNPFNFGAGGSRLSVAALELIAPIFEFDYMGAAEYEGGAVPKALSNMVKIANLGLFDMIFELKHIKVPYGRPTDKDRPEDIGHVYIVGNLDDREEIESRVSFFVNDEKRASRDTSAKRPCEVYLRDYLGLGSYLKYIPSHDDPTLGGLELDNGFFVSADAEMAKKFFDVMTSVESDPVPATRQDEASP